MTQEEEPDFEKHLLARRSLPEYMLLWQHLLETERRKSPDLPVLRGHKAYSQNDEDGIAQEIFRRIGVRHRTFVEIGAGNGIQNNTLFWLKLQWRGAWIDGSKANADFIRQAFAAPIAQGQLHFQQATVTRANVNGLIGHTPYDGREIDLLSIDIDGNDYYVFEQLTVVQPRVVVIEYNARFPPPARWRIPYFADFRPDGSDWFGASLQTLSELFARRDYALVACNITGSNAFFVRSDLAGNHFPCIGETDKLYQPPRYYLTPGLFDHIAGTAAVSVRLDCNCE